MALISASLLALCFPEDEPGSDTFLACLPRPPLAVAVVAAEVDEELPNQERGMVVTAGHSLLWYGNTVTDDGATIGFVAADGRLLLWLEVAECIVQNTFALVDSFLLL